MRSSAEENELKRADYHSLHFFVYNLCSFCSAVSVVSLTAGCLERKVERETLRGTELQVEKAAIKS